MRYSLTQGPGWGQYELQARYTSGPPKLGETVLYTITPEDADTINSRRPTNSLIVSGEQQPMIITKADGGYTISGRVLINGPEILFKENIGSGQYQQLFEYD